MTIKTYTIEYENQLFSLIESEGEEWEYWLPQRKDSYIKSLANSITYVVFEKDQLVGYARTLNDYMIWIVDLLVHKDYRGKAYGKALMDHVCREFSDKDVYVLGGDDVLPYYNKLGYTSDGVVFNVK